MNVRGGATQPPARLLSDSRSNVKNYTFVVQV